MPTDPIDALYQLPLAEFTAARNALAKTLGGADAKRVRALAKPTVVPWAINQLYWGDRRTYDRVMATGGALRDAQIAALTGKRADVRQATEDHRRAIGDAVRSATALAATHGSHPPADQLSRMLEALSLSTSPPAPGGRLTELVQPSGFEALAGVTPAGQIFKSSTAPKPAAGTRDVDRHQPQAAGPRTAGPRAVGPRPADLKAIRAAERLREAEERRQAKAAAAARARAAKKVAAAEQDVDRARRALEAAEQKLARLRGHG